MSHMTKQLQCKDSFSAAPGQGFRFLPWLHLQVKSYENYCIAYGYLLDILCPCSATWRWVEVKVPMRVGGVSRLAPADWRLMSGLGTGDIWFLGSRAWGGWGWGQLVVKPSAVREQTDGRRAKCNSEMYCKICTLHRGTSSLTVPEACCNYYHLKFAIFATVFLVSDIALWVGCRGHG